MNFFKMTVSAGNDQICGAYTFKHRFFKAGLKLELKLFHDSAFMQSGNELN